MPVGDLISATDYNAIRNVISTVMGPGSATRGYGQVVNANTAVTTANQVTKAQWDLLRFDIVNALLHQTGSTPSIVTIGAGDVIRFGVSQPNTQYNTLAVTADTNRFNLGTGQFLENLTVVSRATNDTWRNQASCDITVTFPTANQARYFFNSGGQLRIVTTRTGGLGTTQDNTWSSTLSSAGAQSFSGDAPVTARNSLGLDFYSLNTTFRDYYELQATGAYTANTYNLQARCNVSDNSTGTATEVVIRVLLLDPYSDPINRDGGSYPPDDGVTGTLTTRLDEVKATGFLQPSATPWSVASPTFNISNWSLS